MANRLLPNAKTGAPHRKVGGTATSGEQAGSDINDVLFNSQAATHGNTPMPGLMEKYFRLKPKPQVAAEATRSYTSSSYNPASKYSVPENNGIHPAALAGGIALAGMGASALETHVEKSKKPTALENAGQTAVNIADGAAGFVGNTLGYLQMPMMAMIGGTMLLPLVQGAAGLADKVTGTKKLGNAAGKAANGFAAAQNMTFSDLGKKIGPNVGKNISHGIEGTAKFAAPVLDTAAKLPGLSGIHSKHIPAATKALAGTSVMHGVMRGSWLTGATLGVYSAARNAGSDIYKLRQLIADATGKDIAKVSTMEALTSDKLPAAAKEARKKLLPVMGVHALASVGGLAMALKSNVIDKLIGKTLGGMAEGMVGMVLMQQAYMLPETVAGFAESMVGTPILDLYTQMREAEKSGHKFTAEECANFIYEASASLKNRGSTGKMYAKKIGEQMASEEGTTVMSMLSEASGDGVKKRVEALQQSAVQNAGEPQQKAWAAQIKNERAHKSADPTLAM